MSRQISVMDIMMDVDNKLGEIDKYDAEMGTKMNKFMMFPFGNVDKLIELFNEWDNAHQKAMDYIIRRCQLILTNDWMIDRCEYDSPEAKAESKAYILGVCNDIIGNEDVRRRESEKRKAEILGSYMRLKGIGI